VAGLMVNVDMIARLRQMRGTAYPDVLEAVRVVEDAGASGIVAHLRGDRRHIQDDDLSAIRARATTLLNAELAATEEMMAIAERVQPDMVTIVPEEADEVTTQGGLVLLREADGVATAAGRLSRAGIGVSLFVAPDIDVIGRAAEMGVDAVEIYTGAYATAAEGPAGERELGKVLAAGRAAADAGLFLRAGHGLDTDNVAPIRGAGIFQEYSIGHSIMLRAMFVGLRAAVAEMIAAIG